MFKLDNNFLISMGLGSLPVDEKNKLLQAIYERLEMNVGMRLAEKMTEQQLTEFEQFMDQKDESGALRWLETNFPNYKQVVAEELDKLKNEVTQSAPQILAASQSQSAGAQPAQAAQASGLSTQPGVPQTSATQPYPTAVSDASSSNLQQSQGPQGLGAPASPAASPLSQTDFAQPSTAVSPQPDPMTPAQPAYNFGQQPVNDQANPQVGFNPPAPAQPQDQNSQPPNPNPANQWPPASQPPAGPGIPS